MTAPDRESIVTACPAHQERASLPCDACNALEAAYRAGRASGDEEVAALRAEVHALKLGAEQTRLLERLPLPPDIVAAVKAAQCVVEAADACDREAERHPSSRSSAPVVRSINAMAALRKALSDLGGNRG